jgi:hypothetical protein
MVDPGCGEGVTNLLNISPPALYVELDDQVHEQQRAKQSHEDRGNGRKDC